MKDNNLIVAPSILSADFTDIKSAVELIESSGSEWIHIDVMDGHFVPPITFGHQMVKNIREKTDLVLDVHLMIEAPENQIDFFADAGADFITIHFESTVHLNRHLQNIKSKGVKPGIAIVPSTPIESIQELLPYVDQVLVMTVNPGFGGQKLIPECVEKIRKLSVVKKERKLDFIISADGGINRNTIGMLRDAGLDAAVSGSSFFGAEDQAQEVLFIKGLI